MASPDPGRPIVEEAGLIGRFKAAAVALLTGQQEAPPPTRERKGAGPPPPPTATPPVALEAAIANPYWLGKLREFAATEFSTENINFLAAVASYKLKPSWPKFDNIIDQYIADDAETPVNLPGAEEMRPPLLQIRQTAIGGRGAENRNVFDGAYAEIMALVKSDTYRRFTEGY